MLSKALDRVGNRLAFGLLKHGEVLANADVSVRVYDIRPDEAQVVAAVPAVYRRLEVIERGRHVHVHPDGMLVVDDTADVRDVVTQILEHEGATVRAVDSAEDALVALQFERPDVLLSDLAMPGKGAILADRPGARAAARTRWDDAGRGIHRLPRGRTPRECSPRRVPVPRREAGRDGDSGGRLGDRGAQGVTTRRRPVA